MEEASRITSRSTLPRLRDVLFVCLGIKLLLLALSVMAAETRFNLAFREPERIMGLWYRWDTKHYFAIAEHGYEGDTGVVNVTFPPLLPALMHASAWLAGSLAKGSVALVTILSFVPGLLLFQLARCDLDDADAFRASLVLLLFPTSFFLHIVYTEGLFLSLVLGAFLAARRDNWGAVAVLSFLAGLTRINAFVLAPCLLIEAWRQSREGRAKRMAAAVLPLALAIGLYLGLNLVVAGSPLAFTAIQEKSFSRTFAFPWEGATDTILRAEVGGATSMMNGVLQVLCIPAIVIACVASLRGRASYAVWVIGNVLVVTAQGFWISVPRYLLVLFPAFIWLAPKMTRPVFGTLWFAGSTILLSFLAGLFSLGFWVS